MPHSTHAATDAAKPATVPLGGHESHVPHIPAPVPVPSSGHSVRLCKSDVPDPAVAPSSKHPSQSWSSPAPHLTVPVPSSGPSTQLWSQADSHSPVHVPVPTSGRPLLQCGSYVPRHGQSSLQMQPNRQPQTNPVRQLPANPLDVLEVPTTVTVPSSGTTSYVLLPVLQRIRATLNKSCHPFGSE